MKKTLFQFPPPLFQFLRVHVFVLSMSCKRSAHISGGGIWWEQRCRWRGAKPYPQCNAWGRGLLLLVPPPGLCCAEGEAEEEFLSSEEILVHSAEEKTASQTASYFPALLSALAICY